MILLAKSGNPTREVKELAQGNMTVSGRVRTQTQDGPRGESLITPCCYPLSFLPPPLSRCPHFSGLGLYTEESHLDLPALDGASCLLCQLLSHTLCTFQKHN